jgi:hypothetical protein
LLKTAEALPTYTSTVDYEAASYTWGIYQASINNARTDLTTIMEAVKQTATSNNVLVAEPQEALQANRVSTAVMIPDVSITGGTPTVVVITKIVELPP